MKAVKFDTLDKKPNLLNIAIVSAAALIVSLFIIFNYGESGVFAINLLISIYVLTCIILLIRAFIGQLRYNPYSYNTIYYLGFSIFLASVFATHIMIVFNYLTDPLYAQFLNLSTVISSIASSATTYMIISLPLILGFSIALVISNINLIRYEGRRFVNILGIILAVLLVGGEALIFCFNFYISGSEFEVMIRSLIINVLAALYLYFECMVIGALAADVIAAKYEPEKDRDYIIILGCRPRNDGTPTPLLRARIERAADFYKAQVAATGKAPILIPSGGQGPDEKIAESECMKNHLLSLGIPEEHIIVENKSRNTFENMTFSKELIFSRNPKAKISFSTTNYHVFRSGMYSRRIKMRSQGMGAPTKWWFWPNAGVREFVGLLKGHIGKQVIILGSMIVIYIITTIMSYS